jgi:LysR family hydrogen peroxide-inducible transcriptional activator
MNLRELQYLVALADHRHFGRAAEACHISQPTLSTQLKKLEEFLGVTLFERTNKTVHLTAVGAEVVALARQTLADADAIIDLTAERLEPPLTALKLGIIPTLCPYFLPWFVPAVGAAHPRLKLTVVEDLTETLLKGLAAHQLDAIIGALPMPQEGLRLLPLFDEPFWLACPSAHPLAVAGPASDDELRQAPMLLLNEGHCLRDQILSLCDRPRVASDSGDFRATSLETIRQMVAAGLGCTLLPALALGVDGKQAIHLRRLASGASRRIGLVWRRSFPRAADLERMAETILRHLPGAVDPVLRT